MEASPGDGSWFVLPFRVRSFEWRGYTIKYGYADNSGAAEKASPVLLIHGFGSSAAHYRELFPELAERGPVYAIDLLGFGESDKPDVKYTPELWAELVDVFSREVIGAPPVLVGNSIGSQVALIAAERLHANGGGIAGLCCLNCSGAMNQLGLYDDPAVAVAMPFFWVFERLLQIRPVATRLFDAFRSKENVQRLLTGQVYGNSERVTAELVEILYAPSTDPGALGVFVEVFTGNPGAPPVPLATALAARGTPVLCVWGIDDPWTPVEGPVGRAFSDLADRYPSSFEFVKVAGARHVPFDDAPEAVRGELLTWLERIPPTSE